MLTGATILAFIAGLIVGVRTWMWVAEDYEKNLKALHASVLKGQQLAYECSMLIYSKRHEIEIDTDEVEAIRSEFEEKMATEILLLKALSSDQD